MTKTLIIKKPESSPTNISFLILEDMDNIRQQLVNDLRIIGVLGEIHEASTLKTAISLANSEKIDFIISDWKLPDGTGIDFLKKIRQSERYAKTPFVICSSSSEVNFFLEAIASGANDYIVKPWTTDELKKKIQLTWNTYLDKK